MDPAGLPSGGNFKDLLNGYGLSRFKKHHKYNSLDLLVHYLENPDEVKWQQFMFVAALMHIDTNRYGEVSTVKEWMQGIDSLLPEEMADKMKETDCPGFNASCLYGTYDPVSQDGNSFLKQNVVVEQKALTPPGNSLGVRVGCFLNDEKEEKEKPNFQLNWNGFLRLYNFYQFLPYAYFVTSEGNKAKAYDTIKLFEEPIAEAEVKEAAAEGSWDAVKEITDDQLHGLLNLLRDNEWPVPEAGYELVGENDEIIASAELGWEDLKIAFLTDDEIEYQSKFLNFGWKTVPLSEVLADTQKFTSIKDIYGKDV